MFRSHGLRTTISDHSKPATPLPYSLPPLVPNPRRLFRPDPQPPEQKSYPYAMAHTVCIAAKCMIRRGTKHAVILCSDAAVEIEDTAKGEIPFKALTIGENVAAMFAGSLSKTQEMVGRFQKFFRRKKAKGTYEEYEDLIDLLRIPIQEQNRVDFTQFLSRTYGMKYEEFLGLNEQDRKSISYDHQASAPNDAVIIAWAFGAVWRLFEVYRDVEEQNQFAVIGAGANTAKMSLMSRTYDSFLEIREAMYYVYEAKKRSEAVPGVGERTYLNVLEFSPDAHQIAYHPFGPHSIDRLNEQYAAFGSRAFSADVAPLLDMDYLVG